MLATLHITNFRAFREFRVEKLARVNLFVGTNNAGKTCVLDAVEIFASGGKPLVLIRGATRRGEVSRGDMDTAIELRHLFHGHEFAPDNHFSVQAGVEQFVTVRFVHASSQDLSTETGSPLKLQISSHRSKELTLNVSPSGAITDKDRRRLLFDTGAKSDRLVQFLGTGIFDPNRLGEHWDEIVLTPEEGRVLDALRIIEPRIERIAFGHGGARGSFFLKLSDWPERVPLGSMGDGIKRLLGISLHLARSAGGVLLVDEIDTGLHYSVMVKMWRLVVESAKRLDVQVFATTHSLDCINALAELYEKSPELGPEVLLHRIERGQGTAMTYTADELRIAAEQHMEVR